MSSYSFQGRKRVWTPRDEEENRAIFSSMPQDTGIKMPHEFKPIYLENAEYAVEKWSVKQLIRLLRLYGSHRCLWDVRDVDNRNRQMRKAAMLDIAAALGENVSVEQVLQKINVLRGTYRYEKRRIKQRIRNGAGPSTKLRWFALADAFLRQVPRAERLRKRAEEGDEAKEEDSDSELEEDVVFAIDPEILIPLEDDAAEQEAGAQNQIAAFEPLPHNDIMEIDEVGSTESMKQTAVVAKTPRKWSSRESLQFVALLRDQPALWQQPTSVDSAQYLVALQHVSKAMQLAPERIQKRVRIFKEAYAAERVKMCAQSDYKSSFVWFALAESFMEQSLTHFVDADHVPPATPSVVVIKTEEFLDATPINPIGSVAPSVEQEAAAAEALAVFFASTTTAANETIKSEQQSDSYDAAPKTVEISPPFDDDVAEEDELEQEHDQSAVNNTKLIWNGLEDDLLEGKWSLKHSVKFLRLYGSHRCLWDLQDADYRSRELRQAAIADIAAAMGYGLDADYVAKKIKIFRITYMQHRKRMLAALQSGRQEPEVQLRWFPLADCFLRPHIGLRSIKHDEREMPQFDFQYVYANLNLIDPGLLNDFVGKGTQNSIKIGAAETTDALLEAQRETANAFHVGHDKM